MCLQTWHTIIKHYRKIIYLSCLTYIFLFDLSLQWIIKSGPRFSCFQTYCKAFEIFMTFGCVSKSSKEKRPNLYFLLLHCQWYKFLTHPDFLYAWNLSLYKASENFWWWPFFCSRHINMLCCIFWGAFCVHCQSLQYWAQHRCTLNVRSTFQHTRAVAQTQLLHALTQNTPLGLNAAQPN